jgi:hypothetical protein
MILVVLTIILLIQSYVSDQPKKSVKLEQGKRENDKYLLLTVHYDNLMPATIEPAKERRMNDTVLDRDTWIHKRVKMAAHAMNRISHTEVGRTKVWRTAIPIHIQLVGIKQSTFSVTGPVPADTKGKNTFLLELSKKFSDHLSKTPSEAGPAGGIHILITGFTGDFSGATMSNEFAGTTKGSICSGGIAAGVIRYDWDRHVNYTASEVYNPILAVDMAWILMTMMGAKQDDCTTGCFMGRSCCYNLAAECHCVMGAGRTKLQISTGVVSHLHALMDGEVYGQKTDLKCLRETPYTESVTPVCGNGLVEGEEKCDCVDYFHDKDCWYGCGVWRCDTLDDAIPLTSEFKQQTCEDLGNCGTTTAAPEPEGDSMWWIWIIVAIIAIIVLIIICYALYLGFCKKNKKSGSGGSVYSSSNMGSYSRHPPHATAVDSHKSSFGGSSMRSGVPSGSAGGSSTAARHRYNTGV